MTNATEADKVDSGEKPPLTLKDARLRIAAILAELETSTGCVVDEIELRHTRLSTVGVGQHGFSTVHIHLSRKPGEEILPTQSTGLDARQNG